MEIEKKEIEEVEDIFGFEFTDQQKDMIKCLETKEIQACPGSGKTTALVAKLYILAKKHMINQNQAVCVLTHTNVAIDQIRNKLGKVGHQLLHYPNHCGTIQSFVDKFLAIPTYILLFGYRPQYIDDDIYNDRIERMINLSKYCGAKLWLERKFPTNYIEYLQRIRFNFETLDLTNSIYDNTFHIKDKNSNTYLAIKDLKEKILRDGILTYEDAYLLAFLCTDTFPEHKELFNCRFRFVFIDEMQDMDTFQIEIINRLFDSERTIVQRIGDRNQAIYGSSVSLKDSHGDCLWEPTDCLNIDQSLRFSRKIAKLVRNIGVVPHARLEGNSSVTDIVPKIIAFSNANITSVIPTFGQLIFKNNLHMLSGQHVYKAIGWVKKPHKTKYTIPDYWPQFDQKVRRRGKDCETLSGYLTKPKTQLVAGAEYYRKSILAGIVKALRVTKIKDPSTQRPYTETSFVSFLHQNDPKGYDELRIKLALWCRMLNAEKNPHDEVRTYVCDELLPKFRASDSEELNRYLESMESESVEESSFEDSNICYSVHDDSTIEIVVDTVHNIKGETHTATLYMETFCYAYDISAILTYLKNEREKEIGIRQKQRLRVAYVAVTRPTHLLCLAIHKDNIAGHEEELTQKGWEIIAI